MRQLYQRYKDKIDVDEPSFKNDDHWVLTPKDWIGHLPVTPDLAVQIQPKAPVGNLFRMLEYAYRLKGFRFLEGVATCDSLDDVFDRLANILAGRVLDRARKGLYREYIDRKERLLTIRGRMNAVDLACRPWKVGRVCEYQEFSSQVMDNRILSWTLFTILRSSIASDRSRPRIRQAFRAMQRATEPIPVRLDDLVGRTYSRLNADYQMLHALCRFFLENQGPSIHMGSRHILPFQVSMPSLFEMFVAEWLKANLEAPYEVVAQEKLVYSTKTGGKFKIDMVVYDRQANRPLAVVDTKYKVPESPSNEDVNQVLAYAQAKSCTRALLIYPQELAMPEDCWIGEDSKVHVESVVFDLGGELEKAGRSLLNILQR